MEEHDDLSSVTSAVLTGSRLLVAIAARSLAAVEDRITLPQWRMLVVLAGQGQANLVSLAERLDVNPSTALRMADRLAAAGLITRQVNPDNRRENLIRLTETGQRVVDDITERRREEIGTILARMTAAQRRALVSAMVAFNDAGGEPSAGMPYPLGWPEA